MQKPLDIVIFGLSITSSWGNGHATTFRSLVKALARRGHQITFFEKDVPWYADHRDLPEPPFCQTLLYKDPSELARHTHTIASADMVILGSYVADADDIARRVLDTNPTCFAFYDIDTPVTLAKLERGDYEYLRPETIPEFDLYLSFTGGPILRTLEDQWGAQRARPLYCSVDPELYYPEKDMNNGEETHALGYLGTYSDDRQPTLDRFLIEPARQRPQSSFCVAGAQYPNTINWPDNVQRVEHIPPHQHRRFYNDQRFTLNVTRQDMIQAGFAPSVRLFEAGACGTPIISDYWDGLESIFELGRELLVAHQPADVLEYLEMDQTSRLEMGEALRRKVLRFHTSEHRAEEIEEHWREVSGIPLQRKAALASAAR